VAQLPEEHQVDRTAPLPHDKGRSLHPGVKGTGVSLRDSTLDPGTPLTGTSGAGRGGEECPPPPRRILMVGTIRYLLPCCRAHDTNYSGGGERCICAGRRPGLRQVLPTLSFRGTTPVVSLGGNASPTEPSLSRVRGLTARSGNGSSPISPRMWTMVSMTRSSAGTRASTDLFPHIGPLIVRLVNHPSHPDMRIRLYLRWWDVPLLTKLSRTVAASRVCSKQRKRWQLLNRWCKQTPSDE
jgi:hypothetical protein